LSAEGAEDGFLAVIGKKLVGPREGDFIDDDDDGNTVGTLDGLINEFNGLGNIERGVEVG